MNRLRPTSAADERSIAAKNGHADVIDATINRVLDAAPETSGEDCPDPTALAAWYDAPRKQSHPLDGHLSDCARCQAIVAAIARVEDVAVPTVRKRRWPALMLPALAGIGLVIVGASVLRRSQNAVWTPGTDAIHESPSANPGSSSNAVVQVPPHLTTGELEVTPDTSATNRVETTMETRISAPGSMVVAAPDHSVEWLIGKHGAILRRESDHSIHAQASGVTTDLTAGAAVSSTVCWVIGTSGTILRTTDGQRWETLRTPITMDLVGVQARTADAAMVVAAGGLSYYTIDGGKTWARR
jgi:hypothetical protein